jgi:hypothetical protein
VEIFCACPFTVAALGWDAAAGAASVSLCVKATFLLTPGLASLATLQEPVRLEGAAADAPELVPYKPRADILFAGHAHSPGGAPTEALLARARVGSWRKSLSINGDRTWIPSFEGLRPSVPVPFRRMPLVYERAVRTGENLLGVDISQGAAQSHPLANIAAIADQGGETPGLAAIPFTWRARRLGLTDAAILWASRAGVGSGPPPDGFDFRVFNAAPSEQQVDEIPPGVALLLENLHPEHPHLETRFPAVRVKVYRRDPQDAGSSEVAVRCDTLGIDTDRGVAFLLWRAVFPAPELGTRLVVVAETDAERVALEDVDGMLARVAPEPTYIDAAMLRETPPDPPLLAALIPLPDDPSTAEEAPRARGPTTIAPPADDTTPRGALPFRPAPTGFELPPMDDDGEVTPARGHALAAEPHGTAHRAYDEARVEAWRAGEPLAAVLARRGIDRDAFVAYEAAQREAVEREAEDGGSAAAITWLEVLASV